MRRSAPRPLGAALRTVVGAGAPQTLLARVQSAWPEAAGPGLAGEAEPVSEHDGRVTFACRSAVFADHLTHSEPEVRDRLNEALGGSGSGPVTKLRFAYGRP